MQLPASDYSRAGTAGGQAASTKGGEQYWTLGRLKKAYLDYLGNKRDEIEEQKDSRRLYHGAHWTDEQIKTLKKRNQPIVTYNRIQRKIDGVVGLVERTKLDPKGFARTPKHEDGADLATAVLRYILDQQDWRAKRPLIARTAGIEGVSGVEIVIEHGDQGDAEVGFDPVETDGFFYDPRSMREDFSDARYMGMGKWVDTDTAIELFPDHADEIESGTDGADLSSNSDREAKWFYTDGEGGRRRVRLVECWYKHHGQWCYAIFTGAGVLMEGQSYLFDEKRKTMCKYVMFSSNVDHDGDRYGFVRNLKSANMEINQRRSKALHIANSRRLIMTENAVQDVEKVRAEWARPDGVVIVAPGNVNETIKPEDQSADLVGQLKFLEDAKAEIENFGPNPALIGQGIENKSGRAIALLQQAGMAELGPYMSAVKGFEIRLYRALWSAAQRHWTAERWIRVTDDERVAQYVQINGVGVDPRTGFPAMVNAIGSLDVDIIIDEAPDHITTAQETFENLSLLLPNVAPMLGPAEAKVVLELMVETSALPGSAKKKFKDGMEQAAQAASQPNPVQQIELAGAHAKIEETQSKTILNRAKAQQAIMPEMPQMGAPAEPQMPMDLQAAELLAGIRETDANTELKLAQARKAAVEAQLAPEIAAQQAKDRQARQWQQYMRSQAPAR